MSALIFGIRGLPAVTVLFYQKLPPNMTPKPHLRILKAKVYSSPRGAHISVV